MGKKLRGALLGAGNIALKSHLHTFTEVDELRERVDIVAIADCAAENLKSLQPKFDSLRTYNDGATLLRHEDLDFIDICTPPDTHPELVELAVEKKCHILCEKPLAADYRGALRIEGALRDCNLVFLPCHQYRYSPQVQKINSLIDGGAVGEVYLSYHNILRTEANPGNISWNRHWRTDKATAGGGILVDHGTHLFYQLFEIFGPPYLTSSRTANLRHKAYSVEDTATVVLEYDEKGSKFSQINLTWAADCREINGRYVGTEGSILATDTGVEILRGGQVERVDFNEGLSRDSSHTQWFKPLITSFLDAMDNEDYGRGPLFEALMVARCTEACYCSAAEGRAIKIEAI